MKISLGKSIKIYRKIVNDSLFGPNLKDDLVKKILETTFLALYELEQSYSNKDFSFFENCGFDVPFTNYYVIKYVFNYIF